MGVQRVAHLPSVTFSNIFLVKLEDDILVPFKPMFYRRYVDDMYNRRKFITSDIPFDWSNNYHPQIKPNIDLSPKKFLDTKLNYVMANRKSIEISQYGH